MANIIISGANEGIGYYMAKTLLEDGHRVAVLDVATIHLEKLKETYEKSLIYFQVDMRHEEAT